MIDCQKCAAQNPNESAFCGNCGTSLAKMLQEQPARKAAARSGGITVPVPVLLGIVTIALLGIGASAYTFSTATNTPRETGVSVQQSGKAGELPRQSTAGTTSQRSTGDVPQTPVYTASVAGAVIFMDTFAGDKSTRTWEATNGGTVSFYSDALLINASSTKPVLAFVADVPTTATNFSMETEVIKPKGLSRIDDTAEYGGYGLVFRRTDDNSFYVFALNVAGVYYVARRDGRALKWHPLISPANDPIINKELDAPNRLRVTVRGGNMTFFINEKQVGSVTDTELKQGRFGLYLGESSTNMLYDNVKYEELR